MPVMPSAEVAGTPEYSSNPPTPISAMSLITSSDVVPFVGTGAEHTDVTGASVATTWALRTRRGGPLLLAVGGRSPRSTFPFSALPAASRASPLNPPFVLRILRISWRYPTSLLR